MDTDAVGAGWGELAWMLKDVLARSAVPGLVTPMTAELRKFTEGADYV